MGGVGKPVELAVWTPEQGADFLEERLPVAARPELLELARDFGGLPLALEQAASYLEANSTAIGTYRELLANVNTEGRVLEKGQATTGYEKSVAATLSLAFKKLRDCEKIKFVTRASPSPVGKARNVKNSGA